jgi:hypothetical protein
MVISWWSKHVGVILSVLMCDIWINVLLQTSALVGPLHIAHVLIWFVSFFFCFFIISVPFTLFLHTFTFFIFNLLLFYSDFVNFRTWIGNCLFHKWKLNRGQFSLSICRHRCVCYHKLRTKMQRRPMPLTLHDRYVTVTNDIAHQTAQLMLSSLPLQTPFPN